MIQSINQSVSLRDCEDSDMFDFLDFDSKNDPQKKANETNISKEVLEGASAMQNLVASKVLDWKTLFPMPTPMPNHVHQYISQVTTAPNVQGIIPAQNGNALNGLYNSMLLIWCNLKLSNLFSFL